MEDLKKCEFCDNKIGLSFIRCQDCDLVWNNGVEFGENKIRQELKYMVDKFNELIDLRGKVGIVL